jgi:pyrroline-5-carboxylate reductase
MFTIGAIGAGHMGMEILDAAVRADIAKPSGVLVYEKSPERARLARGRGFAAAGGESEVYLNAQYLLLAVPPQETVLTPVLTKLSRCVVTHRPVVISIMAGIGSDCLRQYLGAQTPVICVMPTIGMSVGHGAAAVAHTPNVPTQALADILRIFTSTGEAAILKEPLLREAVAANGCSPGYAFYIMEALAKAVAERGVDYNMAVRMVARGFAGAAELALTRGTALPLLLAQVCTPGGLTAKGIDTFNAKGLDGALKEGALASIIRGYELMK